jgi:hypothetical protein
VAGTATTRSTATTAIRGCGTRKGGSALDSESGEFFLYLHGSTIRTVNLRISSHNQLLKILITLETMIFKDRHGIRLLTITI